MKQAICHMMHKGALLHKRLMTTILQQYQLTYAQYQVVKQIQQQDGITAKEILHHLDTDKATLSGVLTRLEKAEMIERRVDSNDRRLVHIHLTAKSQSIYASVRDIEASCEAELLKGLKPREIRIFFDAFTKVMNNQMIKLDATNEINKK